MKRKKIKIKISFTGALFFSLLILGDRSVFTVITLASALAHELGHIVAARLSGADISEITIYPFGADIRLCSDLRSYRKDFFISSAGILVNLLLVGAAFLFDPYGHSGSAIALSNLALIFTNIMPIDGLDGGGMLRALLSPVIGIRKTDAAISAVSFCSLFFMWVVAVYVLLVTNGSPSLFVIVCTLFASLFLKEKTEQNKE